MWKMTISALQHGDGNTWPRPIALWLRMMGFTETLRILLNQRRPRQLHVV